MEMRWERASSLCVPRPPLELTCGVLQKPRCEWPHPHLLIAKLWPAKCKHLCSQIVTQGSFQDLPHPGTEVTKSVDEEHDQYGEGLRASFCCLLAPEWTMGLGSPQKPALLQCSVVFWWIGWKRRAVERGRLFAER